jgi:hypothetical protein
MESLNFLLTLVFVLLPSLHSPQVEGLRVINVQRGLIPEWNVRCSQGQEKSWFFQCSIYFHLAQLDTSRQTVLAYFTLMYINAK